ncbi:Matrixin [Pedococcus dokdonensis]|uniref:Matrixin n=1 Tax=Pedococcus dokdonensis TaxID=443156 RepID=A0A1H0MEZ3_9MICO|nr:matrixin family metalloprotease [Pedococcus dokdonensis]SDO79019.1 Matrixin [Pedococcus dokdonensis]
MLGQENDGVVVVSVPDGSTCRCGEQMRTGERAGFDLMANEVICLRCMADRRAGRPQVLNRPQQPWPTHTPAPPAVWLAPAAPSRTRSRGPRTWVTVLVAALVVSLVGVPVGLRSLRAFAGADTAPDDPGAYVFLNKDRRGAPVTWDPCLTIELVVNSASAPAGSGTLLAEAIDRVNEASGLHLKVIGPSTQAPRPDQSARDLASGLPGSARAPVLVAWTTPEVVPGLKGSVVGLGGPVHRFANTRDQERYVGGSVELDGPQLAQLLQRRNGHAQARAVVMHELGHLVGLDHVANSSQVMAAESGTVTEFGEGDRAGLARLGSGGCPYDLTPDTPDSSNASDAPS